MNKYQSATRNLAITAILLAVIIVLQLYGGIFKIGPVTLSFVLIPIVIGGMICGKLTGAILGFAFGLITLIMGISGMDFFTYWLFNEQPIVTSLICIVKGTAAGFVAGLVFELISKKNVHLATVVTAVIAPIVNTGLFILGALTIYNTIAVHPYFGSSPSVIYFLVIVCAGLNFIVELALNIIAVPALYTVYNAIIRRKK